MTCRSQYVSALTLAHACASVVSFQKTSPNTSPLPADGQQEEDQSLTEQRDETKWQKHHRIAGGQLGRSFHAHASSTSSPVRIYCFSEESKRNIFRFSTESVVTLMIDWKEMSAAGFHVSTIRLESGFKSHLWLSLSKLQHLGEVEGKTHRNHEVMKLS